MHPGKEEAAAAAEIGHQEPLPFPHQICRKLNASGPTFVCNANLDLSTSVECLAYLVANVVEGRA